MRSLEPKTLLTLMIHPPTWERIPENASLLTTVSRILPSQFAGKPSARKAIASFSRKKKALLAEMMITNANQVQVLVVETEPVMQGKQSSTAMTKTPALMTHVTLKQVV